MLVRFLIADYLCCITDSNSLFSSFQRKKADLWEHYTTYFHWNTCTAWQIFKEFGYVYYAIRFNFLHSVITWHKTCAT